MDERMDKSVSGNVAGIMSMLNQLGRNKQKAADAARRVEEKELQVKQQRLEQKRDAYERAEQSKSNMLAGAGKTAAGLLFNWVGKEIDRTGDNYRDQQMADARGILDKKLAGERAREDEEVAAAGIAGKGEQETNRAIIQAFAVNSALKEGVEAAVNKKEEQEAIDVKNSEVSENINAVTGDFDGAQVTDQQAVREGTPQLPVQKGNSVLSSFVRETKPAVTSPEEGRQSNERVSVLQSFKNTMPTFGDDSNVRKARESVEAADRGLSTAVEIAKVNRAHYTANGDPFLTYFYNKWYGTTDPDVANAVAYFKECNSRFSNEVDLYKAELATNSNAYAQYMKGKEQYMEQAAARIFAASTLPTDSREQFYDTVSYQKRITEATQKIQIDRAKEYNERFKRGEAIDPKATPSIISGVLADIEAGNLSIADGYNFLNSLAGTEDSFDAPTQKLAAMLRDQHLGTGMNEEAIRAAMIIANDSKLRNQFMAMAEVNRSNPEAVNKKGLNFLYSAFNSRDIENLSRVLAVWEQNMNIENQNKIAYAKNKQANYAQLSDIERNAVVTAVPGMERMDVELLMDQTQMPTAKNIDVWNAVEKVIRDDTKGNPIAQVAVLRANGYDYNNMPQEVSNRVVSEKLLDNMSANPWNQQAFVEGLNKARTAVSQFDQYITAQRTATDSKQLYETTKELLGLVGDDASFWQTSDKTFNKEMRQAMQLRLKLEQLVSTTKIGEAASDDMKMLLSTTTELAKIVRPALLRASFASTPITYKDPATGKDMNFTGIDAAEALFSNTCANIFDGITKSPMFTRVDPFAEPMAREQLMEAFKGEMQRTEDDIAAFVFLGFSANRMETEFNKKYDAWLKQLQIPKERYIRQMLSNPVIYDTFEETVKKVINKFGG